jgi:hypothetical protein
MGRRLGGAALDQRTAWCISSSGDKNDDFGAVSICGPPTEKQSTPIVLVPVLVIGHIMQVVNIQTNTNDCRFRRIIITFTTVHRTLNGMDTR